MPFIAVALIIAAALGGGTSVAAQSSLPGDALWSFKVNVNERIGETVAFGEKAKADWDIALAQARLDEAAKLNEQGKLDADAEAQIDGNFDAHAHAIATRVAALQAQGDFADAADVAARFQATVAKHASALAEAKAHANEHAQGALGLVLGRVQAALDTASSLSADASTKAAAHLESEDATDDHGTGSASTTQEHEGAEVEVHTGTSVKGGTGGIHVDSETGSQIGI